MSSVVDRPAASSNSASRMTDFQRRMKGLVKRNNGSASSNGRRTLGQRATDKPTNLKTVNSLEEYKEALDENAGKVVVVRFFATWCKVRASTFDSIMIAVRLMGFWFGKGWLCSKKEPNYCEASN